MTTDGAIGLVTGLVLGLMLGVNLGVMIAYVCVTYGTPPPHQREIDPCLPSETQSESAFDGSDREKE